MDQARRTVGIALAVISTTTAALAEPVSPNATEPPSQLSRLSLSLGIGTGYLHGSDASQGMASKLELAARLTQRTELTFGGDFTSFARYRPDPSLSRELGVATLGIGIVPFADRPSEPELVFDVANLELRAGLGVAHESRLPYDNPTPFAGEQGAWGGAIVGALDWLPVVAPNWSIGVEVAAQYVYFGANPDRYAATSGLVVVRLGFGTSASTPSPRVARR